MEKKSLFRYIDHTLLKPTATYEDLMKLGSEAQRYEMASVMIPPAYVAFMRSHFPKLTIGTVIGFPLGFHTTAAKCAEAREALENGADELDWVISLGQVKNGEWIELRRELEEAHKLKDFKPYVLKVIIETCYLTEDEKIKLCACVTESGADFLKTSTGFGPAGADIKDMHLFCKYLGPMVEIKAAGGIRTAEQIEAFVEAGCTRIGASAAIEALAPKD